VSLVSAPVIRVHLNGIWNQLVAFPGDTEEDPVFVFSKERAFLSLDEDKRAVFGINEAVVHVDLGACFSRQFGDMERYLLNNFLGYDTVMLNALSCVFDHGAVFSVHSREIMTIQSAMLPVWFKLTGAYFFYSFYNVPIQIFLQLYCSLCSIQLPPCKRSFCSFLLSTIPTSESRIIFVDTYYVRLEQLGLPLLGWIEVKHKDMKKIKSSNSQSSKLGSTSFDL
jgi:hypothetical protein